MCDLEQQQQPACLSRARLKQLEKHERYQRDNQSEEDGDAWSNIGVNNETDEDQKETFWDETSRRKVVANNSRQSSGWQSRPSRSWPNNDTAGDDASYNLQNGRYQAVPVYANERRISNIPKRQPERPSYSNESNPFAPRRPPESFPYSNQRIPLNPTRPLERLSYIDETDPFAPNIPRRPPESLPRPAPCPRSHHPPKSYFPRNLHEPDAVPYATPASEVLTPYDLDEEPKPQPQPHQPMDFTEHQMEKENANLRRDLERMERQMAKRQEEIDKHERENQKEEGAAERRKARRRDEGKMKRNMEPEIKAELEKNHLPKRDAQVMETRSKPTRRRLEYDPAEVLNYLSPLVTEGQIEKSWRMREGRGGPEMNRLLGEFAEFFDRKQQDGRLMDAVSARDRTNQPGRSRLEVVPRESYQNRTHDALRHQVEDIVLEVMRQREDEFQNVDFEPERPVSSSPEYRQGSRSRLPPQTTRFASERDWAGESQRPSRIHWQDDRDIRKVAESPSPSGSLGLTSSSIHTAINNYDQNSPSDSNQVANLLQRLSTNDRHNESTHASAPLVGELKQQVTGNRGDEGPNFPVNAQRDWSGGGRGRPGASPCYLSTQYQPNTNTTHRRRWKFTHHESDLETNSSDESEAEGPRSPRIPREYAFKLNLHGLDDTMLKKARPGMPPPAVPDPPPVSTRKQVLCSPGMGQRRRTVAHEVVKDEQWRR